MRCRLALAALGAVLLTAPAWAQRRGGGMSGGFSGHAGVASHGFAGGMRWSFRGPALGFRGPGSSGFHGGVRPGLGGFHGGFHPGFGFHGRPFFGGGFHHRHFYPGWGWGGYWYPYAWGWGYPWGYSDLGWYDNGGYAGQYYAQGNYANDYWNNDSQEQQDEINRLNDEVADLRERREAQSRANRVPQPTAKSESTELVFRDKHTEEIQNYAVIGQTLWVFTEQRARKIPVAELDLPATKSANDARGVEFALPR